MFVLHTAMSNSKKKSNSKNKKKDQYLSGIFKGLLLYSALSLDLFYRVN